MRVPFNDNLWKEAFPVLLELSKGFAFGNFPGDVAGWNRQSWRRRNFRVYGAWFHPNRDDHIDLPNLISTNLRILWGGDLTWILAHSIKIRSLVQWSLAVSSLRSFPTSWKKLSDQIWSLTQVFSFSPDSAPKPVSEVHHSRWAGSPLSPFPFHCWGHNLSEGTFYEKKRAFHFYNQYDEFPVMQGPWSNFIWRECGCGSLVGELPAKHLLRYSYLDLVDLLY